MGHIITSLGRRNRIPTTKSFFGLFYELFHSISNVLIAHSCFVFGEILKVSTRIFVLQILGCLYGGPREMACQRDDVSHNLQFNFCNSLILVFLCNFLKVQGYYFLIFSAFNAFQVILDSYYGYILIRIYCRIFLVIQVLRNL